MRALTGQGIVQTTGMPSRYARLATDPTVRRAWAVGAVFFLCAVIFIAKLYYLQIVRHEYFTSLAAKAQDAYRELEPERGSIIVRERDRDYPVVTNRALYLVVANPSKVTDPTRVVDTLTSVLGLGEDEWRPIAAKLARRADPYEPLRRKVTKQQVEKIRAAAMPGITDTRESYRYYPEPGFSGQLLGFIGFADVARVGRYGLEGYFERELAGTVGSERGVGDAYGRPLAIGEQRVQAARDGDDLVLTIDRAVQKAACDRLRQGIETFVARGGTVIVLQPSSGAVLAMCSLPNFDPERYSAVDDAAVYNNPAIFEAYEPGSVFKPITMAAAIDLGKMRPPDTYEDTGEIKLVGGKRIRNADGQAHGVQTMLQVLEKSLNTGAVHVVRKVGKESFRRYVQDFGFGQPSGITLDGEVAADISSLARRGEIYAMTASFGQGITVTPLQLAAAFGALANDGRLMRPFIVAERRLPDGTAVATQPQAIRQAVTSRTASTITGMLVQALEGVYDHKAKLPGYYVAGKTGTAQIADPAGGYGQDVHHTFIGYFPAYQPAFVILVKLDRPTKVKHAADSTTVIFRQLAEFLVDYYQLPPQR